MGRNGHLNSTELVAMDDYDKSVFLHKLIILARLMLPGFKQEMNRIVASMNEHVSVSSLRIGPIKEFDRAKHKIEHDYFNSEFFPKSARLLDLLRCSITCPDLEHILNAVQFVYDCATSDDSERDSRDGMSLLFRQSCGYKSSKRAQIRISTFFALFDRCE